MEDYDPDPDVWQSLPKYSLSAGRVCNDAHTDVPTSDGSYSEVNTACEKTRGMIDMHDKALAHGVSTRMVPREFIHNRFYYRVR